MEEKAKRSIGQCRRAVQAAKGARQCDTAQPGRVPPGRIHAAALKKVLVLGLVFTVFIESFDIDDIILNMIGILIVYLLLAVCETIKIQKQSYKKRFKNSHAKRINRFIWSKV